MIGLGASAPALAQSTAVDPAFRQRCAACHVNNPNGQPTPLGPNLRRVVGREAGSSSFRAYSPALKSSGITWNAATLDRYLAAPTRLVPGTRMTVALPDAKQRAAIIAYLNSLR